MSDVQIITLASSTWRTIDGVLDNFIAVKLDAEADDVQSAAAMRRLGWAAGYPDVDQLRFSTADLDVEVIREALRRFLAVAMLRDNRKDIREIEAALGALSAIP